MALKEYKHGSRIPRHDRTDRRTTHRLRGPNPTAPERAHPTSCSSSWTMSGFGQLSAFGGPWARHRTWTPWPRTDSSTTTCTRRRCARRPARRAHGRNHHSNAMACITEVTGPGGNGNIPFENGLLSEISCSSGYNTYALGKSHLTQRIKTGGGTVRPLAAGTRIRALLRLPRRGHPSVPTRADSRQPSVEAEKSPEEGYHLTEDLIDKAISFIADTKQVAPKKPFFMYFCPAPRTRRTRSRRSGRTSTRDSSTTAGTPTARRPSGARRSWGSPGGHRTLTPRPRRARVGLALRRREAALRADDGSVRRIPRPTPIITSGG